MFENLGHDNYFLVRKTVRRVCMLSWSNAGMRFQTGGLLLQKYIPGQ